VQLSSAITAIGPGNVANAGTGKNYKTFCMYVASSAKDTVTQLQTSPDNTTWTTADTVTGTGWAWSAKGLRAQYARANCTGLGTGGAPIQAVVTALPV
jgi:hypothetical protein